MEKRLVINADDLGYSNERDDGIIECFKSGAVTSASLMVNGMSAEYAAKQAQSVNFKIGLHFNITEGKSLSETSSIPSLLDHEQNFSSMRELFKAASHQQTPVNLEQVKQELEKQIEKFVSLMGYLPVHVDGHQHCHILPGIRNVFAETLCEKGIKVTRVPFEILTPTHPWHDKTIGDFMQKVVQLAVDAREVYQQKGIWCSDGYFGLETMGEDFNSPMTTDILQAGLTSVFKSLETSKSSQSLITCELMTHPGYKTKAVGGCGIGPDTFSQSNDRETEMAVLQSADMKKFYDKNDITLVSFQNCY